MLWLQVAFILLLTSWIGNEKSAFSEESIGCKKVTSVAKYERILLLASHILVRRIRILKLDVFWLGVFGTFRKSHIKA